MNRSFHLSATSVCDKCNGTGRVPDPTDLWGKFSRFIHELEQRTGLKPPELDDKTEGEQFQWWRDRGYVVTSWETFNLNTPPDEDFCPDCEGSGILEEMVTLQEALESLRRGQDVAVNTGIDHVRNERLRQTEELGYTAAHDDQHDQRELALAAKCYVEHYITRAWVTTEVGAKLGEQLGAYTEDESPIEWPWKEEHWKPQNPREDLVRAAALLIAEIDRLDRAAYDARRGL